MPKTVHRIRDLLDSELRGFVSDSELVILFGAGVSQWSPTNLRTGKDLMKGIFSSVFRDECGRYITHKDSFLRRLFLRLPFEVVNSRCPELEHLRRLLAKLFLVYTPNPVHELFATLAASNRVHSLITPNYDCAFEQALADEYGTKVGHKIGDFNRAFSETDLIPNHTSKTRTYLKLHGSADDPSLKSLVFHLNQEGMLDAWKRDRFREVVRGRTLLLIGYSGTDFDITPEIPHAMPARVVWNFRNWRENNLPANPLAVADKIHITFLIGDMIELLSRLFDPLQAEIGHSDLDVESILMSEFAPKARRIWRIRLLNGLTFNTVALREIEYAMREKHMEQEEVELWSELAGASASYGHYRDAAKAHELASHISGKRDGMEEPTLRQLLMASDAWRSHGDYIRAFRWHKEVSHKMELLPSRSPSIRAAFLRNRVLLLLPLYELLGALRLVPLRNGVQRSAGIAIKEAAEIYRELGEWYPLQQLRLWSERLKLDPIVTSALGDYETYPSLEGYVQLNFPMGRMMAFRHGIQLGTISIDEKSAALARELAFEAETLGITPEVWKLHYLILRVFSARSTAWEHLRMFLKAFVACQYTLMHRFWQLFQGG